MSSATLRLPCPFTAGQPNVGPTEPWQRRKSRTPVHHHDPTFTSRSALLRHLPGLGLRSARARRMTGSDDQPQVAPENLNRAAPGLSLPLKDATEREGGRATPQTVCAADFFARRPPAHIASDVLKYLLLGSKHRPEHWREWLHKLRIAERPTAQFINFDSFHLLYEAVVNSLGIGIGRHRGALSR